MKRMVRPVGGYRRNLRSGIALRPDDAGPTKARIARPSDPCWRRRPANRPAMPAWRSRARRVSRRYGRPPRLWSPPAARSSRQGRRHAAAADGPPRPSRTGGVRSVRTAVAGLTTTDRCGDRGRRVSSQLLAGAAVRRAHPPVALAQSSVVRADRPGPPEDEGLTRSAIRTTER